MTGTLLCEVYHPGVLVGPRDSVGPSWVFSTTGLVYYALFLYLETTLLGDSKPPNKQHRRSYLVGLTE